MQLMSSSFGHQQRIPEEFAFCAPDAKAHVRMSTNRNPHLRWTGVPSTAKSLVLVCVDTDVPTRADDVNQEGRTVPADLLRTDFYHWLMVDIPPTITEIKAGQCSDGIVAKGKHAPKGPAGSRQGLNDYTLWFGGDADMGGQYLGYDGPCPPHGHGKHHYRFALYALDTAELGVKRDAHCRDVEAAARAHALARAELVGLYAR